MKTILVDAIDGLILKDGTVFEAMHQLLETYPQRKIVLTGANDAQFKQFNLHLCPYELFTLKHNPEKTDPRYFEILLQTYNLNAEDTVFFEHNPEAVASAQSVGIPTLFYDAEKRDLGELKAFLDDHIVH